MNSAERELRSALEIDPNLALAHLMLGEVRVFQNQWDAAQSEILAARKQAGALTEVDQLRVEAFLARVFGKPFEERVYFQKLIGLQPIRESTCMNWRNPIFILPTWMRPSANIRTL